MAGLRAVTIALVADVLLACGTQSSESPPPQAPTALAPPTAPAAAAAADPSDAGPSLPTHTTYPDLAAALVATIPRDARVVGFGEFHARTDRPVAVTSLAAFTAALPAIADRISDLIVETWVVDPKCGATAQTQTAKLEKEVRRPVATKNEVQLLAEAARSAKIQPHAMTLHCGDYTKLDDPVVMLNLTTKELTRIAASAIRYRDDHSESRPWIALYGGALHNNRFPDAGVAEWSYAKALDGASRDHYVEVDIIVPELAEADTTARGEPWFALTTVRSAKVAVWQRGERSFVIVLPRS